MFSFLPAASLFQFSCRLSDDSWNTRLNLFKSLEGTAVFTLQQDKIDGYTHLNFSGPLELLLENYPYLTYHLERGEFEPAVVDINLATNQVFLDFQEMSCE